eukprot:752402-Hanusia_phi.AAC.8
MKKERGGEEGKGRRRTLNASVNLFAQAWTYDDKLKRKPQTFRWLTKPGEWEEVDSWMGNPRPDPRFLQGALEEEQEQDKHMEKENQESARQS